MIINKLSEIKSPAIFFEVANFAPCKQLYLKLEGLNIAGSIKLKSALQMMQQLEDQKKLTAGQSTVICSSSGNLAIAASIIGKERDYQVICVSDPNITEEAAQHIKLWGAKLMIVTEKDSNQGYLGTRLKLIEKLLREIKDSHFLDQYQSLQNAEAHYKTTAAEILKEICRVDYLFVGAGTTGTLSGCARYFGEYSPHTKIIAVDADGSVTFGGSAKTRKIPGLGTSTKPLLADTCQYHELLLIPECETIKQCHFMLDQYGLFLGGSTGTVMAAIKGYSSKFKANDVVVAISPDFGSKYIDTVYNQQWLGQFFPDISFNKY